MEKFKYAQFSPLYLREMTTLEGQANYYERVDKDVERLLHRTPQNHVTLSSDASPEEAIAHWTKYAEETRFQIVQNSRPCFRPPSPEYKPVDDLSLMYSHKHEEQKKPLGKATYVPECYTVPHGPQDQEALYGSYDEMESREPSHLRIGRPYTDVRHEQVLSDRGQSSLSKFIGLRGRFNIFSFLDKDKYTPEQRDLVQRGLTVANESLSLASSLFRCDVLKAHPKNHTDQEKACGFSGLTGLKETVEEKIINGVAVQTFRPTRVNEIAYRLCEFQAIFPSYTDRCLVRAMVGCSPSELPATSMLLSLEEYTHVVRAFSILPKRRRIAFVLDLFDNGLCRGSCFFSSTVQEFTLEIDEQVLEEELFVTKSSNYAIEDGPLAEQERIQHDYKVKFAQEAAFRAIEAQYEERVQLYSEIFSHAESYAKVQELIPVPDKDLRLLTLQYYNEKLEDILVAKILKYREFQEHLRSKITLRPEIRTAAQQISTKTPLEPGFTNVRMGSRLLSIPTQELGPIDKIYRESVEPLEARELELRRKLVTLGFMWTRPSSVQNYDLKLKGKSHFFGCTHCQPRLFRPTCQCLSSWLEANYVNPEAEIPYLYCNECEVNQPENSVCSCLRDEMLDMSNDLAAARSKGSTACRSCKAQGSCRCPLLCLIQHNEVYVPKSGNLSLFYRPRPISETVASISSSRSTPEKAKEPSILNQLNLGRGRPSRHPLYGRGRPSKIDSETSSSIASDDSSLISLAALDSSIESVSDSDLSAQLEALADHSSSESSLSIESVPDSDLSAQLEALAVGDLTVAQRTSLPKVNEDGPGLAGLSEVLADEIDQAFLVDGHLTRAYLRDADFDPQLAARLDHNYAKPGPRKVKGFSEIPDGIYPFNGHLEGYPYGVPRTRYTEDGGSQKNEKVPSLYSSAYKQRHHAGRPTTASMLARYTKVRADGTRYCPQGTLCKVLKDHLLGPRLESSADATDVNLFTEIGERVYSLCQPRPHTGTPSKAPKDRARLALKVRSCYMEEPTDLPPNSRRNWVHRIVDIDTHGSTPCEVSVLFSGHLSWISQGWKENILPTGQRFLESTIPGKNAGTFTMSTGAGRPGAAWPMKICGRFMTLLLAGGGLRKTRAAFKHVKAKATDIQSKRKHQRENPPLVDDCTEGAAPGSKTIDPSFEADDFYGQWQEVKEPGKEVYYQRDDWSGFGFSFATHGYNVGFGQRTVFTAGQKISLETVRAIYGLIYWLVDHFDAIRQRYVARCRHRGHEPTENEMKRCFSPLRFQLGSINPGWAKYVATVPTVLGRDWRTHLENLLFDLNDDVPLMYRYTDTVGPDVKQFLGEPKQFPEDGSEQLGRIDSLGRPVYLEEECEALEDLNDYGHSIAEQTADQRSLLSTKGYSSLECARSENL